MVPMQVIYFGYQIVLPCGSSVLCCAVHIYKIHRNAGSAKCTPATYSRDRLQCIFRVRMYSSAPQHADVVKPPPPFFSPLFS